MGWSISAEVIAFLIVLIISVYSRRSHPIPSLKNRLFALCLGTTLGAIGTNLVSTLLIAFAPPDAAPLTWIVTLVYFVLTPLLGTTYCYYALAVIGEARAVKRWVLLANFLPCAVYLVIVAMNIFTGSLFYLDENGGYHQGPLIFSTYLIFYYYCVATFIAVVITRAPIDPAIKRILAMYPLIAIVVIGVQQMFPTYLLSGSAAACSLLIIYLYLQNKRLSIDLLTGIPNRQEFLSMVGLMHEKDHAFTAVLISLSNFKFINDKFGHENGDLFLREFAEFLEERAPDAHLYRYSGDQFAYIIDEETPISQEEKSTTALLNSLRERLDEPWRIDGHLYTMSAAIGAVHHPTIICDPKDVIAAIEYATEQAKLLKANEACLCTPAMIQDIHRRSDIAEVVRKAIKNRSIEVYFQPIWSEKHNQFIAAEALCRLSDDKLGSIPPDEFITIAEQTGLVSDLCSLVLEQACAFTAAYFNQHPHTLFRGVSVNFSPVQFIQDDLEDMVLEVVKRHNIPPSSLRIELTESAVIANPEKVRAFMTTMRKHGVLFYLDDFGTGYSNLSTVLNLPFDLVKIDKSILWLATSNLEMAKFLDKLIGCFISIDSLVLCEGVETEEQRALLNHCGCTFMQGYLFSRPLPAGEASIAIEQSEQDCRAGLSTLQQTN